MSPYQVVVRDKNNADSDASVLSSKIQNAKKGQCMNIRYITVAAEGEQCSTSAVICSRTKNDPKRFSQVLEKYTCIENTGGFGYTLIRYYDNVVVSDKLMRLVDCQIMSLEDYCNRNDIEVLHSL